MMSGNAEYRYRKFPEIILKRCNDCPYCQWDSEPCGPSGYRCEHEDGPHGWLRTDKWTNYLAKEGKNMDIHIPNTCPLPKWGDTL